MERIPPNPPYAPITYYVGSREGGRVAGGGALWWYTHFEGRQHWGASFFLARRAFWIWYRCFSDVKAILQNLRSPKALKCTKFRKKLKKKNLIRNESPQGRPQGRCRPIFVELVPLERLKKSREQRHLEAAKYYKFPSFKNSHEVWKKKFKLHLFHREGRKEHVDQFLLS